MTKEKLLDKRWAKANLTAWYLQLVPFIRFIGITGSLAFDKVSYRSDINIFIIAKNNRIWTCFYLSRMLLKLLRQQSSEKKKSGKITAKRFSSDKYLIINPQNKYLAEQYNNMVPIYDEKDYYCRFLMANKWFEKFGFKKTKCVLNLVHSGTFNVLRNVMEIFLSGRLGRWIENNIRKSQLKKITKKCPNVNQQDSSVVANDNEINLHSYQSK